MISLIALSLLAAAGSEAGAPARIAVLVGSNEPMGGTSALRYADRDVESVAEVLVAAGRFAKSDVHVLVDTDAAHVMRSLDNALAALKATAGETMLFFYYSGHADDHALYLKRGPLALADLRTRLERPDSTVRVGIVDACRGGAWTRAKGLSSQAPFEVAIPLSLSSEGSVLIASSSGLENAHEAESLRGSFFTHYLVAGLRGAADISGDGIVTLNEAYAYAKERTVRDTALLADEPQHPSFSMNLRGRSDLPLTAMANSATTLSVEERRGPLQLIHLGTGLKVLELGEGKRSVLLAVAPGKYVLRRKQGESMFARELELAANQSLSVDEDSLRLDSSEVLAIKGPLEIHAWARSTLPAGKFELDFGMGVLHETEATSGFQSKVEGVAFAGAAFWGLTDRLQWPILIPALTYRWGDRPGREWLVSGGLDAVGHK